MKKNHSDESVTTTVDDHREAIPMAATSSKPKLNPNYNIEQIFMRNKETIQSLKALINKQKAGKM